jgi:hypothetical protein
MNDILALILCAGALAVIVPGLVAHWRYQPRSTPRDRA